MSSVWATRRAPWERSTAVMKKKTKNQEHTCVHHRACVLACSYIWLFIYSVYEASSLCQQNAHRWSQDPHAAYSFVGKRDNRHSNKHKKTSEIIDSDYRQDEINWDTRRRNNKGTKPRGGTSPRGCHLKAVYEEELEEKHFRERVQQDKCYWWTHLLGRDRRRWEEWTCGCRQGRRGWDKLRK